MGCFSFMCKECGEPINSNSLRGQRVKLFLLKEGKIIEEMEGEYDSYGRVFAPHYAGIIDDSSSVHWSMDWSDVCHLMFGDDDEGIAAIHSKCFKGLVPTTNSDDDPNQGWGENLDLIDDTDPDLEFD